MAETRLSVRLLDRNHATPPRSAAFRMVLLSIFLGSCSMLTSCGSNGGGASGDGVPTGQASTSLACDPVVGVVGYLCPLRDTLTQRSRLMCVRSVDLHIDSHSYI